MKKAVIATVLTAVLCIGQTPLAHAESPLPSQLSTIIITEIQTGGVSDATEEFVELYNPGDNVVDVGGWQVQYRTASSTSSQSWPASSTKATLAAGTTIPPHARLVVVHTIANIAGSVSMTGGFSGTGGQIRLIQPGTPVTVHDFVGYGTAVDSEGQAAPAPSNGTSIKRKITVDGLPIDSNNNANDFLADCGAPSPGIDDTSPLPYTTGCAAPPTETSTEQTGGETSENNSTSEQQETNGTETGGETESSGAEQTESPPTYLPLAITELLPDPASPQQDANDEFIELYNPNDTAVTLRGYRLQTGNDYRYSFTLGDTPLGPHMYLAIPSAVSKLSLVNSGSGVRLLDPHGDVVDETVNYGDAKEGQSWMRDVDGWHWSLSPTPGTANILTLAAAKPAATTTPSTKKKTTATSAKTSTPKVAAPKAATTPKKTTADTTTHPAEQVAASTTPQYWLLIPIGAIVGGYAIYEYRQEIAKLARKCWSALSGNRRRPATEEE